MIEIMIGGFLVIAVGIIWGIVFAVAVYRDTKKASKERKASKASAPTS